MSTRKVRLVSQPTPTRPAEVFTRKVWAMVWTVLGAIALVAALAVLDAFVLQGSVEQISTITTVLTTGLVLPTIATVAAYFVRERDASGRGGT